MTGNYFGAAGFASFPVRAYSGERKDPVSCTSPKTNRNRRIAIVRTQNRSVKRISPSRRERGPPTRPALRGFA